MKMEKRTLKREGSPIAEYEIGVIVHGDDAGVLHKVLACLDYADHLLSEHEKEARKMGEWDEVAKVKGAPARVQKVYGKTWKLKGLLNETIKHIERGGDA